MTLTIYGVALNDRLERNQLSEAFVSAPYLAAPRAPVLYFKPSACRAPDGTFVTVPQGSERLHASPTFALLFPEAPGVVGGAALALDVSLPQRDYYRPAVRQQGRDGFLPLGRFQPWRRGDALPSISATLNGALQADWRPERMVRDCEALVDEIGAFMSLSDGDVLLMGLQADPVPVRPGDRVELRAEGHPDLRAAFVAEAAA